MVVLGIETSCDETASAVYCADSGVRSNVLFSQIDLHKHYGGVVPEIASRAQIEKINLIVKTALKKAAITLDDIDAIAVTHKPGLAGSLLVGLCFAKSLAYATGKKLIGINHLEGHVYSALIEHDVPFPHLCLTASGGHTSLYLVKSFFDYTILGTTLNDAAGEAFDKVAKMLELGYPGGPIIEKLANQVNFEDFFCYPRMRKKNLNFSFSGLKTAILYDLVKRGAYDLTTKKLVACDRELQQKVASSMLVCIKDIFIDRIKNALDEYPTVQAITLVGGVACNSFLRKCLQVFSQKQKRQFFTPSRAYCTDNGAMIAFVGYQKLKQDQADTLDLDIF